MADAQINLGYDDTPHLSGCKWRVHDSARPQPRVVTPGTESTQEQVGMPPSDAIILFDGGTLAGWIGADGKEARWKVEHGYLEVAPGTGNISTRQQFGDGQFHLEWMEPVKITGNSQARGNSGIFLMEQYEIQVLDGYDNPTYADGACGGIYGQCPPLVNSCRRPGEWQTYEIVWLAPRFKDGKLVSPAWLTVFQNGILLHHKKELLGPTRHKLTTHYEPHAATGPLMLQDHGDLVRYRHLWYRPLTDYDED